MALDTRLTTDIVPWSVFLATGEADWRALWNRLGTLHDQSPQWLQAIATGHTLDPASLFVITARDAAGALCLVYPIQRKTRRKAGVTLSFIEPLQNVFCMYAEPLTPLTPDETVAAVMGALRRWRQTWHWIEIENLDGSGALMPAWQAYAERERHATQVTEGLRSPFLLHQGSLEDFLGSKSKKFRKKVRGLVRDVDDDANVRVEFYQQPDELTRYYAQALVIEARSWKHADGAAITSRDWERAVYDELLRRLGPLGVLKGAIMFIGDQPVAHSLELLHGHRILGLKSTFDQSLSRLSPGNMLMIHLLSHYFDAGCHEYDFLGGDEDYKLEWSATVRPHRHLRLYGHSLVARGLVQIERWRQQREARAVREAREAQTAEATQAAPAAVPDAAADAGPPAVTP